MNAGLELALAQNDELSGYRANRISTLAERIFMQINDRGLTALFAQFSLTYRVLEDQRFLLGRVRDSSLPFNLIQLFANRHGFSQGLNSGDRTWQLGGMPWNASTVTGTFTGLIGSIRTLYELVFNDPYENLSKRSEFSKYPFTPTTSVSSAYISRLNYSVQEMIDTLRGLGGRRGNSDDAIVSSMDDILKTLQRNVSSLFSKNLQLAANANRIAWNAEYFDNQVAALMGDGNTIAMNHWDQIDGGFAIRYVDGNLAPERSERLSRGENILTVRVEQRDSRGSTLISRLGRGLDVVTEELLRHTHMIVSECDNIIGRITMWNEILDRRISSRPRANFSLEPAQTHDFLRSYLPQDLHNDIASLRTTMIEWRDGFGHVHNLAQAFYENVRSASSGVRDDILEAIYPSDKMDSKRFTVKGIGLLLETCAREYHQMAAEIESQMEGRLITAYAAELVAMARHFEEIADTIRQDFNLEW